MSEFRNFSVEFPERLAQLDGHFRPLADRENLQVSYLLMRLTSAFLLPYERTFGDSGEQGADVADSQRVRKVLELDKPFTASTYALQSDWTRFQVSNYSARSEDWIRTSLAASTVHQVLQDVRYALSHSNLRFAVQPFRSGAPVASEKDINYVFLAARAERLPTQQYRVTQFSVTGLDGLVDQWVANVTKVRTSPHTIWREIGDSEPY